MFTDHSSSAVIFGIFPLNNKQMNQFKSVSLVTLYSFCSALCMHVRFLVARSRHSPILLKELLIISAVNNSRHATLTLRSRHAVHVLQHHLTEMEVRNAENKLPGRLHDMLLGNQGCVCMCVRGGGPCTSVTVMVHV